MRRGRPPSERTNEAASRHAAERARCFGTHNANGRPLNRSALAAWGPPRSRPARGWPPTKCALDRRASSLSATASTGTFNPATSITRLPLRAVLRTRGKSEITLVRGTASTAMSALLTAASSDGAMLVSAPRRRAIRAAADLRSYPMTRVALDARRSARPADVPMRPVPIIATARVERLGFNRN